MSTCSSTLLLMLAATTSAVAIAVWHPMRSWALSAKDQAAASQFYFRSTQRIADAPSLLSALRYINAALALDPQNTTYMSEKAKILFELEEDEESLKVAQQAIKLAPHCAPAWSIAGKDLERLGKLQQACSYFDTAAKLEPNSWLFEENRGKIFVVLKRWAEAEKCLTNMLELERRFSKLPFNRGPAELGLCYLEQKKWKEAIANSNEGIKSFGLKDNHRREYYKQLAQAYEGLKDYQYAIANYHEILKLIPDDRRIRERILTDYEALGDKVNAIREKAAIEAFDNDVIGGDEQREQYERKYLKKPH